MVSHPKRMVSPTVLFCLPRSGLLLYVPPYLFIVEHIYFNVFVVYTGCWQRGGCSVLCCGQELHISIMQIVIITLSAHVCVCVSALIGWELSVGVVVVYPGILSVFSHQTLALYSGRFTGYKYTPCTPRTQSAFLEWTETPAPPPVQRTHTHADTSFSVAPFARVTVLSMKRASEGRFHLCPAAGGKSAASL